MWFEEWKGRVRIGEMKAKCRAHHRPSFPFASLSFFKPRSSQTRPSTPLSSILRIQKLREIKLVSPGDEYTDLPLQMLTRRVLLPPSSQPFLPSPSSLERHKGAPISPYRLLTIRTLERPLNLDPERLPSRETTRRVVNASKPPSLNLPLLPSPSSKKKKSPLTLKNPNRFKLTSN